jgi:hypothetical protein
MNNLKNLALWHDRAGMDGNKKKKKNKKVFSICATLTQKGAIRGKF